MPLDPEEAPTCLFVGPPPAAEGAQGTAIADFGAFPGGSHKTITVTGQSRIRTTSIVEAWLYPAATADHSADEHVVEAINVLAGSIVEGVGFSIDIITAGIIQDTLFLKPTWYVPIGAIKQDRIPFGQGAIIPRIYGQWSIAWRWS